METVTKFVATAQYKTNHVSISPGNITPNEWYQQFTNNRGAPDLSLISILSEIVYWYRPKRAKDPNTGTITYINKFLGDAWQTSYEHFEKKFGFNREKIRRIFVKLEQMRICTREFRNVKLRGQTYNNRLFIHLSSDFLNSCTNHNENKSTLENKNTACNVSFFTPEKEEASPHFGGDHIIDIKNKNIIKDRSIKSNFAQNISVKEDKAKQIEESDTSTTSSGPNSIILNNSAPWYKGMVRTLKEFYPLSQEDCDKLQSSSRREFNLNAMNEILLDMSRKLADRMFRSKQNFMNYMAKALSYEMRDAVKINNEGFRIKANLSLDELTQDGIEEYLAEIENSYDTSLEAQLKKKLACVLEPSRAFKLLRYYLDHDVSGEEFTVKLKKNIELSNSEQELILKQIKAVYERYEEGELRCISSVKIEVLETKVLESTENSFKQEEVRGNTMPPALSTVPIIPNSLWGQCRLKLIEYYGGERGEAIDKNWFSKLEAEIEEGGGNDLPYQKITLKSPSIFIKDWISSNYGHVLERVSNSINCQIMLC